MAKDNAQSSFQRGVMSLLILSLLDQEDMYGYQIVQEIAARSGGTIVTQEGSLYPVLYKLQDQGMISGEKVLVGKRMTRVYYHLEEPGHRPSAGAGARVSGDDTGRFSNHSKRDRREGRRLNGECGEPGAASYAERYIV